MVFSFPLVIRQSKADVVPIDFVGVGNFLPEVDVPFIMTNANITFKIDANSYRKGFNANFTGNYTIFNPGASENVTLAAPFSSAFTGLESSCVVKIDENTIAYSFSEYTWGNFSESTWEQYVSGLYYPRKFIIINVTFPENDSITIDYSFNAYIDNRIDYGMFQIFYDVGTSRAWNGTITEQVEFKVYGKQPYSYSGENCIISEFEDGMSYIWYWENEIINEDRVYISYSIPTPWYYIVGRLVPFLIIGGFFVVPIILIHQYKSKKAKRELNKNLE